MKTQIDYKHSVPKRSLRFPWNNKQSNKISMDALDEFHQKYKKPDINHKNNKSLLLAEIITNWK